MRREEHLFVIVYDISDTKRWRRVFRLMNGYGEWLQLSVFQCLAGVNYLDRPATTILAGWKRGMISSVKLVSEPFSVPR